MCGVQDIGAGDGDQMTLVVVPRLPHHADSEAGGGVFSALATGNAEFAGVGSSQWFQQRPGCG